MRRLEAGAVCPYALEKLEILRLPARDNARVELAGYKAEVKPEQAEAE